MDDINGTWKLETIDTTTSAPSTPSTVDFWTLNFATGMKPDLDVQVPGTWTRHYGFSDRAVSDQVGCFANWYQPGPGHGL